MRDAEVTSMQEEEEREEQPKFVEEVEEDETSDHGIPMQISFPNNFGDLGASNLDQTSGFAIDTNYEGDNESEGSTSQWNKPILFSARNNNDNTITMTVDGNKYCLLGANVGPDAPKVCQEASLMASNQPEEDNSDDVFVNNGVMSNISETDLETISVQFRNLGEIVEEDESMRGITQDPALA